MNFDCMRPAILLSAVFLFGGAQAASADDEATIQYREVIMKQIEADATALGMIVSGRILPDSMALHAQSIANGAKAALKAFQPNVPGGKAKPEVWTKGDDFVKRMQTFAQKSEELAKVAATGNVASVAESMVDALPCKDCHDVYRKK